MVEQKNGIAMKNNVSKAVLLLGFAFLTSTAGFAQETKLKVERDNYELKVKQEGDEFKLKEKGVRRTAATAELKQTVTHKEGETVTTIKRGEMPKQTVTAKKTTAVKKKTYAARKKAVAKKPVAKKRTVAYKPKAKTRTRTAVAAKTIAPVIVRDTVFVTRVDTVFSITETSSFTGNRPGSYMHDNFKKLKIEREDDGEIILKKEYEDGEEIKKTFDNEADFQTYMNWRNY